MVRITISPSQLLSIEVQWLRGTGRDEGGIPCVKCSFPETGLITALQELPQEISNPSGRVTKLNLLRPH